MNELVPLGSGTPKRLVRLWSRDFQRPIAKPDDQPDSLFIVEHVAPGGWLPMTVDYPDGRRWSGRAEMTVKLTRDDEHLRKMAVWPNPLQG